MSDAVSRPHSQATPTQIPSVDRDLLDKLDREQLYEFLFMQVRNIWRVDGLYFLGIEKRHDMEEATEVDAECWRYMGKAEARELKKFLGLQEPDPAQALLILRHTAWAISHEAKSFAVAPDGTATFTVDKCRTQLIRLDKGLSPHPCRMVREGYLEAFAQELNPRLTVRAVSCPPQRADESIWCRWEFSLAQT